MATLTVGSGQQYSTLAAAVAAAHPGDDIQVQAGTYTNDFAGHVQGLTIEGVGGMARFVATQSPDNGKAEFVTDGNVTLRNIEVSGVTVGDGNGAAVRDQSGNLTLDRVYFHDNQEGLLANDNPNGSVNIQSSEFGNNGNDGLEHNIYINNVGSTTVNNSYIHDVLGHGSEFRSRGANTTITNTRIVDQGHADNYTVDLPAGGNVDLENDVFEKASGATNPIMVHYAPDQIQAWHSPSSLTVKGSTFINDDGAGNDVGIDNLNGPGVSNGGPTQITADVENNTVYGLDASHFVHGPANQSGTNYTSTRPNIDTSEPWASGQPQPSPQPPTSSNQSNDTLVLNMSGDLWQGSPQFTVAVDGVQQGGVYTTNADHEAGNTQEFDFSGHWGAGQHDVAVTFINDAWGGPGQDRNLYIDSATYDGTKYTSGVTPLWSNGSVHIMVGQQS